MRVYQSPAGNHTNIALLNPGGRESSLAELPGEVLAVISSIAVSTADLRPLSMAPLLAPQNLGSLPERRGIIPHFDPARHAGKIKTFDAIGADPEAGSLTEKPAR